MLPIYLWSHLTKPSCERLEQAKLRWESVENKANIFVSLPSWAVAGQDNVLSIASMILTVILRP